MILTDILIKNAEQRPHRTALVMKMGYRTASLSYQDVYVLSARVALFLEKSGIGKGDKVLMLAPNSPYWVCVFWGTLLRGAVAVPLNLQSTEEMVRKIAEQTEARILFKHLHFRQPIAPGLKTVDIEFIREETADLDEGLLRPFKASEEDLVEIMYTSGTTGDPKGVMLTHRNLGSNVEALAKVNPVSSDDRFLSILPLSHIFEQVIGFLFPFSSGALIVYAHSPAAIRDLLKQYRITTMAAVPEFLRVVMGKIEARAEEEGKKKLLDSFFKLSSRINFRPLRRLLFYSVHRSFGGRLGIVASGGAPLEPELEGKWNSLGIDLLQGYGLTETSPVISTNTLSRRRKGSVGKVLPGVEVGLAQDGEILVRGAGVFQGYYKKEPKTKDWFSTGDMGELDADGFLYLKGRKKYMIKGPGAQNVFPEDIEFELNRLEGVKDSCVVGLSRPGGKVEIHAVLLSVAPKDPKEPSLDPEQVIEKANQKLASYQRINGFSLWPREDFPRSATRKVRKEVVLAWLAEREKESCEEAPREEAKTPLMQLLSEVTATDLKEIKDSTKIVPELHLDSLLRIELVARIEEKFGVSVEEAKIIPSTTVSELESLVRGAEPSRQQTKVKGWPVSRWASLMRFLGQNLILLPLAGTFVRLKVEGEENLEGLEHPAVFMPNHLSYLDSLVVVMALPLRLRKKIAFAAARDMVYERYRPISWLLELLFNCFPFPRQEYENLKAGLDAMGRRLDEGWSVVVYPEGRLSQSGELQALKRGAGLVAVKMGVPIVCVKLRATQDVVPYGKILPRKRGLVTVRFSKPVRFDPRDSYIQATEKIQQILREL